MKLVLAAQTIFLQQGEERVPTGAEVLARFEGPDGAQLTQSNIEDAGWIAIDNSVSLLAQETLPALMRNHRTLFFNLSVETLQSKTAFALWFERLRQMAAAYPRRIAIEISNRNLDINERMLRQRLDLLKEEPISLLLDNAELTQGPSVALMDFEWNYCKISARDLARIEKTQLKSAIDYCRSANIHIIAERIENNRLLEAVSNLRIPFKQGFALAKPEALNS
jgi:EAL domain-containing protein (putative c-di-GMP-specific phosphodiesterase class I)